MKRIAFSFLLIVFISTTHCFAQNDSSAVQPKTGLDSTFHFPLVLKTPPLTLIDIFNGASGVIVAESFPTKQISISMELGAYYRLSAYNVKHLHGWRSGMELRYYFNENSDYDYFFGVRYFYKKIGFNMTDSIRIDSVSYAKDHFVHKEVHVVDFVFGTRYFTLGKKTTTELYCGIGVRFKNTVISDLTQNEIDHRQYGDSFIFPILMESGATVHFDVLFGIKVGIGIGKAQ